MADLPIPDHAEQDDALLYEIRVTLTERLNGHVSMPPEQRAEVSRALTDAITPDVRAALAATRAEVEKLRRQVMGYRGMKDVYLSERNEAYTGLREAERIIERLCDDREAGQQLAKAALTEQRERAEEAEQRATEQHDRAVLAEAAIRDHGSKLAAEIRYGQQQYDRAEEAEALCRAYDTDIAAVRRAQLTAEAAIRRVREMAEAAKRESVASFARRITGEPFPARLLADDVITALDAEGRQGDTLAAVEQARTLVDALIATIPQADDLATVQQVAHRTLLRIRAALDTEQPKETPTCCWFDGDRCMTHGTEQHEEAP